MDLSQKSPFAVTMTNYIQNKIDTNQETFGWQLPCRVVKVAGAIVTVAFEIDQSNGLTFPQVECAIAQSTFVRLPVQVGDFGICVAANARLGGVNGLGSGVAPLSNPLNLEGLVYVPIGNANWEAVDPNAVNINAPNGVVLRDTNNNCVVTLTPSGITVIIGSTNISVSGTEVAITANTIALNGVIQLNGPVTQGTSTHGTSTSFIGPMSVTNDVTAEGKSLATHVHDVHNVQGGSATITTTSPD